ncbi:MAG: DUF3160 domain-containing protein [Labilithrix sp.]|nr:DUF3160 domain-containing protein [Labilithrix sp.]
MAGELQASDGAARRRAIRSGRWAIAAALLAMSCATPPRARSAVSSASAPAPRLPEPKARARRAPPQPDWFWEPVDVEVRTPARTELRLPVAESGIARLEGSARIWDALGPEARARLGRDGVLVLAAEPGSPPPPADQEKRGRSIGAFYSHLREQRIPHVVTIDALFALVHVGLTQALARVEELELAPAVDALLQKLDARLAIEKAGAKTGLADAYRLARGVVSVARALAATTPYAVPPDLAKVVAEERGHVEGHAGAARSPLFGVTIDYARFAAPSTAARPGTFRALAWLAAAPLTLVARSETTGGASSVYGARTNARAAMLLARLCNRDVDERINAAYTRVSRLLSFVWGPPDDLSLAELDDLAEAAGVDLRKAENISNVVRVDQLRARALAGRAPLLFDGSGQVGHAAASSVVAAPRGGVNVRLFGGHAAADSLVLQSLVGASVGLAREAAAASEVDRLRGGYRVVPSTLDVAAWLGAPEARSLLRESNADAFDGYDATLSGLRRSRAALEQSAALHASVHGSLVDALIAWANAEPEAGIARTTAADRMRVESLLASWTLVRHVGQAMARARPVPPAPATELHVSGAALPVFVEPLPDVVSRLVSVVRQARRGIEALGDGSSRSATTTLVEVEDLLRAALKGAERNASDEALSAEEAAALASLPARIAKLEDDASEEVGPVVAVVYSDPKSRRLLATATGDLEPALMLARDPTRDEPVLVVGAHLAHHEIVEGFDRPPGVLHAVRPALTDAAWRARRTGRPTSASAAATGAGLPTAPARAPWTASFRWTR